MSIVEDAVKLFRESHYDVKRVNEVVVELAEGSIDAGTLLVSIAINEPFVVADWMLRCLKDMHLSGGQIVTAYEYCENDIKLFAIAIMMRDQDMLDHVNSIHLDRHAEHGEMLDTPFVKIYKELRDAQAAGNLDEVIRSNIEKVMK